MDRPAAERWIRGLVSPSGPIEIAHERPWSTVMRVPLATGPAWFKACGPVQAFEPRLTAELFARWPYLVPEVLGHDENRAWLLLADAGEIVADRGNPPEAWERVLPLYAELQRGEASRTGDHLRHDLPDLRLARLPERYDSLLRPDLPVSAAEVERLRLFAGRFDELCRRLAAFEVPETIQHDDLHMNNLYVRDGRLRVLDWGDASIAHPFFSLVTTFRFLEERNKLPANDPWFARLQDAYLEGWDDRGLAEAFPLALRVGAFAHCIAWDRQRDHLPVTARPPFDEGFSIVLRRALRYRME